MDAINNKLIISLRTNDITNSKLLGQLMKAIKIENQK